MDPWALKPVVGHVAHYSAGTSAPLLDRGASAPASWMSPHWASRKKYTKPETASPGRYSVYSVNMYAKMAIYSRLSPKSTVHILIMETVYEIGLALNVGCARAHMQARGPPNE